MAKHPRKEARQERATRPLKEAHGKKPRWVKMPVASEDQVIGIATIEQQGLEPNAAELQLVDLAALGQERKSVAHVAEVFEVEVVSDAEDPRQGDEPE